MSVRSVLVCMCGGVVGGRGGTGGREERLGVTDVEIFGAAVCIFPLPASHKKGHGEPPKGLFFILGGEGERRKPHFDCETFDNQGFSCTSQGCAWVCLKPAAALGDQECERQLPLPAPVRMGPQ